MRIGRSTIIACAALAAVLPAVAISVDWPVMGSGGQGYDNGTLSLVATVGEPVVETVAEELSGFPAVDQGATPCWGLCLGDMDCNGDVDFSDIDAFVLALGGQAAYYAQHPNCYFENGDCDEDGDVDFDDITTPALII